MTDAAGRRGGNAHARTRLFWLAVCTLVSCVTFLTSCAVPQFEAPERVIKRTNFRIDLRVEPRLNLAGLQVYDQKKNTCTLFLQSYTRCLYHEIRHCIEGNWHAGRDSDEDCD